MALRVLFEILVTSAFAQDLTLKWQLVSPGGQPPDDRSQHTAVWSPTDDGMYVYGGVFAASDRRLHFYDRKADEWQQLSPSGSPAAHDSHSAVWSPTADGMYIFGGNSHSGERLNELDFYSRQANSWYKVSPSGTFPTARRYHTAVWSPEADGMYLFAGSNFKGIGRMNDLHFYHRQANQWQQLYPGGSPPSPRDHHSAVWSPTADGMYIFGGFNGSAFLNDVHFYDRKANEWQQLFPESSPKARYQHTAVWSVATDGMYIYGGWGESGQTNDVHFYDRQANAWQAASPFGVPKRHGHTAVWSPSGMYIFGGGDADLYCYGVKDEVTSANQTTTSITTSTAFTTASNIQVWSGNMQFTLDGVATESEVITAVQMALATWFQVPKSAVQVEVTGSGRRLAQLWSVAFTIRMDANVVPDLQGAAVSVTSVEQFGAVLEQQLQAAGAQVTGVSGLEVSMELVQAGPKDERSNEVMNIIIHALVICVLLCGLACGSFIILRYCCRPAAKKPESQDTARLAEVDVDDLDEVEVAMVPPTPYPPQLCPMPVPLQRIDALPVEVPEYWLREGSWKILVDESTLAVVKEMFGTSSLRVDCAWRIEKEDQWREYVEERNKVLQHMEQLQQQSIFLEPWTSKVEEASRKLPGKLLTEVGERYLFSTDGSLGSLEIKDFEGFGNGIYLSDEIEKIDKIAQTPTETSSTLYCFLVRTTCGACLHRGSGDDAEVLDSRELCVPGTSPPFSYHSLVGEASIVCFNGKRVYPEYLVAYRKAGSQRVSL